MAWIAGDKTKDPEALEIDGPDRLHQFAALRLWDWFVQVEQGNDNNSMEPTKKIYIEQKEKDMERNWHRLHLSLSGECVWMASFLAVVDEVSDVVCTGLTLTR